MSVVQTLNGAIDSSEMGYTLSHEHIFVHDEGLVSNFPSVWNEAFVHKSHGKKLFRLMRLVYVRFWMHLFLETEEMLRF